MNENIYKNVTRLNEFAMKVQSGLDLNQDELRERAVIRDEIINYFSFVLKNSNNVT